MNTSLEELYNQYQNAIEKQKMTIEEYRAKLNQARLSHNFAETAKLNKLIRLLYEEKLELEGHAISIREYFKN